MKQVGMWVGIVAVIILAVVGLILLSNSANSSPPPLSLQDAPNLPQLTTNDLQEGNPQSKATIIEYADFQCPACGAEFPILNKLYSDYKGKFHFVYRFYPLTQIHKNALLSVKYGYGASLQGKFWQMHDVLFAHQNDWAEMTPEDVTKTFDEYAKQLGLNLQKLHTDIADKKTDAIIAASVDGGNKAGVNSTPTMYLNGKQIVFSDHLPTYDELKTLVDQALNQH